MNFFEKQIETCERRIRKIQENPDPSRMRSTALLYELERDLAKAQLQALQERRPMVGSFFISPLFRAMGSEYVHLMQTADRTTEAPACFNAIRAQGYPEDGCDRTIVCIGMGLRGDLPPLSLIAGSNFACDPEWISFKALAYHTKTPIYHIDVPMDESIEAVRYVAEQLRGFIEFAEKIPGIRYDEAKHIKLQEIDRKACDCLHEIYELRKTVPCPMRGIDVFRIPRLPSVYSNPQGALGYYQMWKDEILERAAGGIGALKEEKMRVLWNISAPYHADPFSILERKGVAVPFFNFGVATQMFQVVGGVYGDEIEYGRKLTLLEEEARMLLGNQWRGKGDRWVKASLKVCRELKLDAIINFLQMGCTTNLGLAKVLADKALTELGIPTLHIDGRQMDTTPIDTKRFNQQLEDFIDICLSRKQMEA